jgi:hypothetical protein
VRVLSGGKTVFSASGRPRAAVMESVRLWMGKRYGKEEATGQGHDARL